MNNTVIAFLKKNMPEIVKYSCALILAVAFFLPFVSMTAASRNALDRLNSLSQITGSSNMSDETGKLKDMSVVNIIYYNETIDNLDLFNELSTVENPPANNISALVFFLGFLMYAAIVFIMFLTFWKEPVYAIICDIIALAAILSMQIIIGSPANLFGQFKALLLLSGASSLDTYTYGAGYYLFLIAAVGNITGNIMTLLNNKKYGITKAEFQKDLP